MEFIDISERQMYNIYFNNELHKFMIAKLQQKNDDIPIFLRGHISSEKYMKPNYAPSKYYYTADELYYIFKYCEAVAKQLIYIKRGIEYSPNVENKSELIR